MYIEYNEMDLLLLTTKRFVVHLGDRYACNIGGIGILQLQFQFGYVFMLEHVPHVPQLKKSLINTGQLDDDGFHINFGDGNGGSIRDLQLLSRVVKVILHTLSMNLVLVTML